METLNPPLSPLPALTFLVEWENARDVEMMWTERAMRGLAD